MQAASTVYVIIVIEYTRARAVEMQQVLDATRQIVDYNLVLNWISRLNVRKHLFPPDSCILKPDASSV